jgi:hypothetical protein
MPKKGCDFEVFIEVLKPVKQGAFFAAKQRNTTPARAGGGGALIHVNAYGTLLMKIAAAIVAELNYRCQKLAAGLRLRSEAMYRLSWDSVEGIGC